MSHCNILSNEHFHRRIYEAGVSAAPIEFLNSHFRGKMQAIFGQNHLIFGQKSKQYSGKTTWFSGKEWRKYSGKRLQPPEQNWSRTPTLIWQKEASDKSDISRKRAKCVCHLHWRQWNIRMSYLTYLLVGWVFLHEIWPGRRAHYVNYENINNSNLDGMSLASFCQSRATVYVHFLCIRLLNFESTLNCNLPMIISAITFLSARSDYRHICT